MRERIARLFDPEEVFVEDGLVANCAAADLPADGVVTGVGVVNGRHVRGDGQQLLRQGGVLGRAHRREDRAHPGDRRALEIPLFYLVD